MHSLDTHLLEFRQVGVQVIANASIRSTDGQSSDASRFASRAWFTSMFVATPRRDQLYRTNQYWPIELSRPDSLSA